MTLATTFVGSDGLLWFDAALIGYLFGIIFMVFGVIGAANAYRNLSNPNDPDAFGKGMTGALFGAIMLGFGLHSFLRARRIKRS